MSINILKSLKVLSPFTEDINRYIHGRGIEDEVDITQRAIQERLNYLEDKGVLTSEFSGRTKQFRLNKDNPITSKLIVMSEITKFCERISENFEVRKIVEDVLDRTVEPILIYGSFVKGNWKEKSDLDVLVVGSENEMKGVKEKYSRDIHFMFITSQEFRKAIKENKPFMREVLKKHIICRGYEDITTWRFEHE